MDEKRLRALLNAISRVHLAVAGDYFLDYYLVTDPSLAEISLETGLVAHQVVAKRSSPGAAGTIVSNLAALGVDRIHAIGVIGDDGEGVALKRGLHARRAHLDCLFESDAVFTPTYTKPMRLDAGGEREMERLDIKNRHPLPRDLEEEILWALRRVISQVDGVIVADQVQERNCGVITDRVRDELTSLAEARPRKLFFVDSRTRIGEFRGVVIKPNRLEAARALDPAASGEIDRAQAAELGCRLAARTGQAVVVTLSEDGALFCSETTARHIPAVPVPGEVDPVGAGDSTTAGIVAARCAGATWEEAVLIGNLVASVTVRKLGTTGTASPEEVLAAWAGWAGTT